MTKPSTDSSSRSPRSGSAPRSFRNPASLALLRSSSSAKNGWDPTERAKYARDPWAYFHDILHIRRLTEDQNRLLEAVVNGPRTLSTAANAVGKCLESRSLISLADGRRVKAADLVGQEFQLLTIDERGCIVAAN